MMVVVEKDDRSGIYIYHHHHFRFNFLFTLYVFIVLVAISLHLLHYEKNSAFFSDQFTSLFQRSVT